MSVNSVIIIWIYGIMRLESHPSVNEFRIHVGKVLRRHDIFELSLKVARPIHGQK